MYRPEFIRGEKQNTFHGIQIPHIHFPALVFEKQHYLKNQKSINRTRVTSNVKMNTKVLLHFDSQSRPLPNRNPESVSN
jgi:hypothetical protein